MRAVAGAYLALFDGLVTPATAGFLRSIEFVTMAVLGGLGSILGSIVGAALLTVLPQVLTVFHDYEHIVLGLIMIVFMIFLRAGIVPSLAALACAGSAMSVLAVDDLGIDFGGLRALDGVSFASSAARSSPIIGPNGAGKTTLFNLISGLYRAAARPRAARRRGRHRPAAASAGAPRAVAHLPEPADLLPHDARSRTSWSAATCTRTATCSRICSRCRRCAGRTAQTRERGRASCSPASASPMLPTAPAGRLPYGALKRLEIARALATEPKVLLLDEPAAGCNAVETEEIDAVIQTDRGAGHHGRAGRARHAPGDEDLDRIHVLDQGRTLAEGSGRRGARESGRDRRLSRRRGGRRRQPVLDA